jgi:hypothetical protein
MKTEQERPEGGEKSFLKDFTGPFVFTGETGSAFGEVCKELFIC